MARGRGAALLSLLALAACSREARTLGPTLPQTAPAGDADPRIADYQDNFYQVAEGSRYFAWYGCARCHGDDLADGRWRHGGGFAQVYAAIATRHGPLAFGRRVPVAQLWQLTAYVRDLPQHPPEKRVRQQQDAHAEPQGATWNGPQ